MVGESGSNPKNLALILRDVLQKLDQKVGGPPYNLSLHDRPFLRPRGNYWKTIEGGLPLAYRNPAPNISYYWATGFFCDPVAAGSRRPQPLTGFSVRTGRFEHSLSFCGGLLAAYLSNHAYG